MVNKLLDAQLGTVLTQDPSISLKSFLSTNWAVATGYSPPIAAAIRFDTKFGNMSGENFVIIENMPQTIKPQILGKGRVRITDVKRLQIYCVGHSSKDNKWKMEKHIESLINGNPQGLNANGIDIIDLSEFVEIEAAPDNPKNPAGTTVIARSRALVSLIYDEYQAVA